MITTGRDRLRKTIWLRSQARAIGSNISTRQLQPELPELWFSDFARRSDFDRVIREAARQQQTEQRA